MTGETPQINVPFVGRQTELSELHGSLQSVRAARSPLFVLIEGEYGVGKTTLVEHFMAQVRAQSRDVLIGQGRCTVQTEVSGLIPMNQLLMDLAERGSRVRIIPGQVLDFVKEVAPAWLDIVTLGAASATVTTIEEGARLLGHGGVKRDSVFVQFTNALAKLAEKQPVIAFIDDLQWADASSLNLLFHLALSLRQGAILFLCAYRPVEGMEMSINAELFRTVRANLVRYGARELEVKQGLDVAEYAAQRYPGNAFPQAFLDEVQQQTGGHALYVHELFSLWEETGVVVPPAAAGGAGEWRLTRQIGRLPVVPELSAVLEERLHRMESSLRELLTVASVEGDDFTLQVLARVRKLDEYQVCTDLETLEHRYRLVQEAGEQESGSVVLDFYRFAHRFFRDYVYDSLGGAQKRILHQQVGECLEGLYEDRHLVAGQLALHFREARNYSKAADYALMAARLEQSRYATEEVEHWCNLGLDLLKTQPSHAATDQLRFDLTEQLGDAHYVAANYLKTNAVYRAALELAQEIAVDPERLAQIYDKLAETTYYTGQSQEAMRLAERAKTTLVDYGVPFGETHFRVNIGWAYLQSCTGHDDVVLESIHDMLSRAEELPTTHTLACYKTRAYHVLAVTLCSIDRYREALDADRQAIEIAKTTSDRRQEAIAWLSLSDTHRWLGELPEAMTAVLKGMELATQIGDQDDIAYAHDQKGLIFLGLGQPAQAREEFLRALRLSEQIGAGWNLPSLHVELAQACLALSDVDTAHEHASRALSLAEEQEFTELYDAGHAFNALAQVETAQREWSFAQAHYEQAMDFFSQLGDRHLVARTRRNYGISLALAGKTERAIEQLHIALPVFEELGLDYELEKTKKALDEIV